MSSSLNRDPLPGIIRQKEKVVGAVCLPEEDVLEFIAEFNRCYGPLSMHIEPPQDASSSKQAIVPVGAQLRSASHSTPLPPPPSASP
ncbi:MAG: hypothetical protein NXI32_16475 [bacterium]|nr:hypothetical protein [bacterium]